MAPTSVAGIHLRLIQSAKRTFKFPDAIKAALEAVLHAQNIRGTFSVRSLRATKGTPHRKGFAWTAVDESEGLLRFTYQPGDNNTCVRYTLTPDECVMSLSELFTLLQTKAVVAPKPARKHNAPPAPTKRQPITEAGAPVQKVPTEVPGVVDPVEVLLQTDLPAKEVRLRLTEIAAMLERAHVVKTEMERLAKLYAEEKGKLRKIQKLFDDPRYAPILAAFTIVKTE